MKKIISLALAVFMVLSTVIVASALSYNGFSYRSTLTYDAIIITGYTGTEKDITIPSEINGLPVTTINQEAFAYNKTITSVEIPSSIKDIGNKAFFFCSNISEIDFNSADVTIGNNAFYNCSNLLRINGASNVSKIDSSAFDGTPWLNNQSDGIVYIGKTLYKFKGAMSANANLTVRSGIVSISPDAFANQTNLAKISFPTSLKNVGYRAFCGCTGMTEVILLKHIESIETAAFGYKEVRTGTSISYVPIDGFKIYTEQDSAAHNYAERGGLNYEFLGEQLVTSLKLNAISISWDVGKSGYFKPTVLPENASNKTLVWSSSDESVATVSADGKLTAVGHGVATITCKTTDGSNLTATCRVSVTGESVFVKRVKINKLIDRWGAGRTDTVNVTITPDNATNKTLKWESSNEDVLTVDANGKVTAVSSGFAILTCSSTDGSDKKSSCLMIVNPGTPQSVRAVKDSSTTAKITWSESPSATGYYIYRATAENGSYKKVGSSKTTSFTDKNLKSGQTYYYKVVSYDFATILLFKSTMSAPANITM